MNWYQQIRWPQKDIVFTGQSGNYSRAAYIVENSTVGCQLTVRSVRPSDAGTYICELLISNRAVEASAKLLVFGKLYPIILCNNSFKIHSNKIRSVLAEFIKSAEL